MDLGAFEPIRRDVEAWRDLASTPHGPTTRVGARLHERLLAPLGPWPTGATTLLVLPDDVLTQLPFGALVTKVGDDGQAAAYVLDDLAVRYAPSAAVHGALAARTQVRKPGRGLLAFGDPTYGADTPYAPLPGSRVEVERIAKHYPAEARRVHLGDEASIGAWTSAHTDPDAAPWRALHVACHGSVDRRRPYATGLVLAGGDVLTLSHLERQRIESDLVVLSGCETAGGTLQDGEGVVGLVRSFFQVGVPRVVVSTWPVSDRASVDVMDRLHRSWATQDVDAAVALREARLALRRSKGPHAHPCYWAPFVLWGP